MTITSNVCLTARSSRLMKMDPNYHSPDRKLDPAAYRRYKAIHVDPLPMLHPGAIAVDQKPPATVPDGYVPAATISLHYADYFYDICQKILADLVVRELLDAEGDPTDFEACFVDLEKAARAHAIWVRGHLLGWKQAAITDRILSSGSDSLQFQRLLGRFMVGHRWRQSDRVGIVGFYRPAAGVDLGEMGNPMDGWHELMDFRAGK